MRRLLLIMVMLLVPCMLSLSIHLSRIRDVRSTLTDLQNDGTLFEGSDLEKVIIPRNVHLSEAEFQTENECEFEAEDVESEPDGEFSINHRSQSDFTLEDGFSVRVIDSDMIIDCSMINGEVARSQMLEEDKVPLPPAELPALTDH